MSVDICARPSATYALVVGIERYAAGQDWDLNGPASDACRFVEWLISRGVPTDNIVLFLSSLDRNRAIQAAVDSYPATRENIYHAITQDFKQKQGDLLFLWWGGHGVITAEHSRRLFYPDATPQNFLNLDFSELLALLRSEGYAGLPHQVGIIDTCANYIEGWHRVATLPRETFAQLSPLTSIEQFIFYAGKAGDVVNNLNAERTGLFSKEVLAYLAVQPADHWPPDLSELAVHLENRFTQLRAQGLTAQTPNYFWAKDWAGNERTLGRTASTPRETALIESSGQTRELTLREKWELSNAVANCPTMADPIQRQTILNQLRGEITGTISRNPASRIDIFNIVTRCLDYQGGLRELRDVIFLFEGTSIPMQQLDKVIHKLGLASDS